MLKGYMYSFLSTIFFALPTVFLVLAYKDNLTPNSLILNQSLIAAILIFIYIKATGQKLPKLTRSNLIDFILTGAIGKAGTTIALFYAINYMSVSLVMTIVFMYPAIIIVLEYVFDKQKISLLQLWGLLIIFLGETLVMKVFQGEFYSLSLKGVALSLTASIAFGWMLYWTNKKLNTFEPVIVTGYTTFFCTICLLVLMPPVYLFTDKMTLPLIMWSLFFAITTSVLANLFLFASVKYIGAARSSIISILELPLTVLFAFLLLKEHMDIVQILGTTLIFLGICFFNWKNSSYFKPESHSI
ncbi:DMT family transporter [Bacillus sp. PK3_68]|uniref:DMT family transporter n=1 Tax=Bacillus sp. PK3_68 TaxID=2027408 RepID=UPI000E718FA6|nr:DMT family transporter [Bacillus sp. PK3_68]RJS59215.1 hypothetical protein CJ483_03315 [Bacillus sp. PK3_68]